jgi:chromosome segregation ATPase
MSEKISASKANRLIQLFLQGLSQVEIAKRLGITQSTVSLYIEKYKKTAASRGVEEVSREFGAKDLIQSLHSLAEDLRKEGITIKEAKSALEVYSVLQEHGVAENAYADVIWACLKMHDKGYAQAAVELSELEKKNGLDYRTVLSRYQTAEEKTTSLKEELSTIRKEINDKAHELQKLNQEKKQATSRLKSHLAQVDLNLKRLEKVEGLVEAIKRANWDDSDLDSFIQYQKEINNAGIKLEYFIALLRKVKELIGPDQGKGLLDALTKYGNLNEAKVGLEAEVRALVKQTGDLQTQKKSKEEAEHYLITLRQERTSLEKDVTGLLRERDNLTVMKNNVALLQNRKNQLERTIADLQDEQVKLQNKKEELTSEIVGLTKSTSDLKQLEQKRNDLDAIIAGIEEDIRAHRRQLDILDSFTGFIEASSYSDLEGFAAQLPSLIAGARQKKYSPQIIRDVMLQRLTGGRLQVLGCDSCSAKFVVDKPSQYGWGYHCPACYSTLVRAIYDETKILKRAIAGPKLPAAESKTT